MGGGGKDGRDEKDKKVWLPDERDDGDEHRCSVVNPELPPRTLLTTLTPTEGQAQV
jgi:hypothetical protein